MMYRCLIIDDEDLARKLIETHLAQLEEFVIVASCASALEANKVLQKETVDLIFLDIEMPVLKGTGFLKNLTLKPKVIFTTAYREYAIEGFDLNAVDYLLKPITFERFFQAIQKFTDSMRPSAIVIGNTNSTEESHIFIQSNKKNIKLLFDDVTHIESIKDYVRIHLKDSSIILKHGITAFQEKLDARFIRVHRSYIINAHKITAYTKQDIEIGKVEIPIGESYKTNVLKSINHLN